MDQPKKISQEPIATSIAANDRFLFLYQAETPSPSVRTITSSNVIGSLLATVVAGLAANVITMTANNTLYVGTVTAANVVSNAQLSANLANYQTSAGLAANVATLGYQTSAGLAANVATLGYQTTDGLASNVAGLTSNNATNLGGTAASGYQTTAGLAANVAALTSK
jgi:hypothetical protein